MEIEHHTLKQLLKQKRRKKEIRKYLKANENENNTLKLRGYSQINIRRKFIRINKYILKDLK